ncbi:hypothetical protein [Enterococcus sp. LJL51]|uniref:hypothetical protein n=1 Tax=Enterococcus sp. LJL51 TaxID=3416656 RepID=UPI003CEF0F44
MKFKKVIKSIVLLPLLIFLATFIYGLLSFDVSGMDEGLPYGLIYSFVIMGYVYLAYLLAFVLNGIVAVVFLIKFSRKSVRLQFLISGYLAALLLLVAVWLTMGYSSLFPFTAFFAPGTLGVCVASIFVAALGWSISNYPASENNEAEAKKIEIKSVVYGLLLPVLAVSLTAGVRLLMVIQTSNNKHEVYQEVIEAKLAEAGTAGTVKVIKSYGSEDYIQLDYVLTQEAVDVYGKGVLNRENAQSEWELTDSTLTTYKNSVPTILQVPAHSEAGQRFLSTFSEAVEKAIVLCDLADTLGIDTPLEENEIRTAYDSPYFSMKTESISSEVEAWAKENGASSDKEKAVFDGYAALTIEQLMTSQTVSAVIPIQHPYKEGSDLDEREQNVEEYYKVLIKAIDFSAMVDGYYEIIIGNSHRGQQMLVKNHKVVEVIESQGGSMLKRPEDNLGSYTSSEYMQW